MPHDNQGRIFISNGMGIDVRAYIAHVLGRNTGDVGQLCGDVDAIGNVVNDGEGVINMWSLYKPVRNNGPGQGDNWNAAWSGNYGIAPYGFGMGSAALTALRSYTYDGKKNGWVYERPRGTVSHNEWFRVMDFNGYNHSSPKPFNGWTGVETAIRGGNVWFGLDDVVNDWTGTPSSIYYGNIQLKSGSTVKYLRDCYFGVAIFNSTNNCIGLITCQNKMGASQPEYFDDGNWSCGFDDINWPAGTYRAFPFFWISDTNAPMPSGWTNLQYGELYSIPYTTPKQVIVRNAVTTVELGGACGIDGEYSTTILIGFAPTLIIDGTGTYVLNRMQVLLSASGGSGFTTVYDTNSDSAYSPVPVSSSGSPYQLVDSPSGSGGDPGITNCPPNVEMPKLPGTGKYTATVIADLTPINGGNPITVQKSYEIS